jgi:signal transduction histidine kinase
MVVEDEMIVARDIELQLTELGYQIAGHTTLGEVAIKMAGELMPDLVLMDIQLAGAMDGIAAARAIREQLKLPVVFLTAFAAEDILERAKLTEPFGYILKPFSERDLRTVIEMALYKHQADEKLRLHQLTLADQNEQLREMSLHQQKVKEEERIKIAREIHDDLGGLLTGIKSYLSVLIGRNSRAGTPIDSVLQDAADMSDEAIETVRRLISDLRPSVLDQLGIWPALEWYTGQIALRTQLVCQCLIEDSLTDIDLTPEASTAAFRIVQELTTNIVRHADAQKLTVRAKLERDLIHIEVEDDGKGIASSQLLGVKSWGIIGMHERAQQCHGNLTIDNITPHGTIAILKLPMENINEHQ